MSKIIQQVHFADGTDLYICGFDVDNDILRYRKSGTGTMQVSGKISIEDGKVKLSDCWFDEGYLQRFLIENEIIKTENDEIQNNPREN
jgi:hypothetical protein